MGLSIEDRGWLESMIDNQIKATPELVKYFRLPENKREYQIKDENEFAFASLFGYIVGKFEMFYASIHNKTLTGNEQDEAMSIIKKRLREIKDSLFEAG